MRNKLVIILITIVMLFTLCGCGDSKEHLTRLEAKGDIEQIYFDTVRSVEIFTDPRTKVQYIMCYRGQGVSITPRLNSDGTLCIADRK